jgi:hypothetical protein
VLSYEDVPISGGPPGATYTFQTLLHDDGRITYQYRTLGPLPARLSVGIQRTLLDYLSVGCGGSTPIKAGLAIEFRPQPNATLWLNNSVSQGMVQPGETRDIALTLVWTRPHDPGPYRGRVIISSTDAWNPTITRLAQVVTLSAPHEQSFPVFGREAR